MSTHSYMMTASFTVRLNQAIVFKMTLSYTNILFYCYGNKTTNIVSRKSGVFDLLRKGCKDPHPSVRAGSVTCLGEIVKLYCTSETLSIPSGSEEEDVDI